MCRKRLKESGKFIWENYKGGKKLNIYKSLAGKPQQRRPFDRLNCRWSDNIKMSFGEITCEFLDWNQLSQDMVSYEQGVNLKLSKKKRDVFDNLLTTSLLRNDLDLITYETGVSHWTDSPPCGRNSVPAFAPLRKIYWKLCPFVSI